MLVPSPNTGWCGMAVFCDEKRSERSFAVVLTAAGRAAVSPSSKSIKEGPPPPELEPAYS